MFEWGSQKAEEEILGDLDVWLFFLLSNKQGKAILKTKSFKDFNCVTEGKG